MLTALFVCVCVFWFFFVFYIFVTGCVSGCRTEQTTNGVPQKAGGHSDQRLQRPLRLGSDQDGAAVERWKLSFLLFINCSTRSWKAGPRASIEWLMKLIEKKHLSSCQGFKPAILRHREAKGGVVQPPVCFNCARGVCRRFDNSLNWSGWKASLIYFNFFFVFLRGIMNATQTPQTWLALRLRSCVTISSENANGWGVHVEGNHFISCNTVALDIFCTFPLPTLGFCRFIENTRVLQNKLLSGEQNISYMWWTPDTLLPSLKCSFPRSASLGGTRRGFTLARTVRRLHAGSIWSEHLRRRIPRLCRFEKCQMSAVAEAGVNDETLKTLKPYMAAGLEQPEGGFYQQTKKNQWGKNKQT